MKWLYTAHPAWAESLEAPRSQIDLKRRYLHPRRALRLMHPLQTGCALMLLAQQLRWGFQLQKGVNKFKSIWDLWVPETWILPDELLEPCNGSFDRLISVDFLKCPSTSVVQEDAAMQCCRETGLWISFIITAVCIFMPIYRNTSLLTCITSEKKKSLF